MDLDDIRMFVKVAELRSFAAAAQELRIQNSLLSRRIARLEASLGTRLLQRTTRKVSLTEEGRQFYEETARGLDQLNSAVDSLNSMHGVPRGKLRISSPLDIGQYLIMYVLPEFMKTYPEVSVEWDFLPQSRNLIQSGADLSIRSDLSNDQSLVAKKIGSLVLEVFRAPGLAIKLSKNPTLEEIEALPWIVFTRGALGSQRPNFSILFNGEVVEIQPKNIRFRTNSLQSIRSLVAQGLGVGVLPKAISDPDLATGTLVSILPKRMSTPAIDFYAVYPSREYLSPKVRVMIDWLTLHFPNWEK